MEKRIFGSASDFYRVRIIKIIEEGSEEIPWTEGAAYFPPVIEEEVTVLKVFEVQIISIAEGGIVKTTGFSSHKEAGKYLSSIQEELSVLTVNQFKEKYDLD